MMAAMTAQPPLPLVPQDARAIGAAAAIVEDEDGGRVFVHGNLAYAWDAGDAAGRRFAAVSLVRIKAATQLQVAEAFGVKPASVRRWETRFAGAGVAGLLAEPKGPKRKSKLTGGTVGDIRRLRDGGASYRAIAAQTGVSQGSVRAALVLAEGERQDRSSSLRCGRSVLTPALTQCCLPGGRKPQNHWSTTLLTQPRPFRDDRPSADPTSTVFLISLSEPLPPSRRPAARRTAAGVLPQAEGRRWSSTR
jgi:hypothetical protein